VKQLHFDAQAQGGSPGHNSLLMLILVVVRQRNDDVHHREWAAAVKGRCKEQFIKKGQ
jgi:hypothetical protein